MQAAPADGVGRIVVGLHNGMMELPPGSVRKAWKPDPQPSPDAHVQTQPSPDATAGVLSPPVTLPKPNGNLDSWEDQKVNARDVFWMTSLMAAACGLGAVPFFFIAKLSAVWAAMANAVACGVMLAASFDLLHEAEGYGALPLIVGLVVGCVFIKSLQDWLAGYEDVKFEGFKGADAQKVMIFVGVMAAHAVGEGSGVGAPLPLPRALL